MTYLLSADEIAATVRRVAKADSIPWGLAEELGYGAKWLSLRGINACAYIRYIFETYDHTQKLIQKAANLNDRKHDIENGHSIRIENIPFPILLAPFIAAARYPVSIIREGKKIIIHNEHLYMQGTHDQKTLCTVTVMREKNDHIPPNAKHYPIRSGGCRVKKPDWAFLTEKAGNCFVPESDISRQRGAG